MKKRINGKSFDFDLNGTSINVSKFSLDITDNSQVAKTKGIPDGYTDGDVEAAGEIELTRANFKLIKKAAQRARSFRAIKPFDISAFANSGDEEIKVEVFGCKMTLSNLLDIDTNSADQSLFKIPYFVTSHDFVRIDGIPYLDKSDVEGILES